MDEYKEQEKKDEVSEAEITPDDNKKELLKGEVSDSEAAPVQEKTRAIPAAREPEQAAAGQGDSPAPRRRRRSDRYLNAGAEEEKNSGESGRYTDRPVLASDSATAREAAERMGLRPRPEDMAGGDPGSRIPPQAAAWNRARAAENAGGRKGMSEAARVRLAGGQRTVPQDSGSHSRSQESVGYAAGRMAESNPVQAAAARARMEAQRLAGTPSLRKGDGGRGVPPRDPRFTMPPEAEGKKKHGVLTALLIVLLAIGAAVVGLMLIPDNAEGLPGNVKRAVVSLLSGKKKEESGGGVLSFTASGHENAVAPTDVSFSITASKNVSDIRLVDEEGNILSCSRMTGNNTDQNLWTLTWHLNDGYEGEVGIQSLTGANWTTSELKVNVSVASLPQITIGVQETPTPEPVTPEPESGDGEEPEAVGEDPEEKTLTAAGLLPDGEQNLPEGVIPPDETTGEGTDPEAGNPGEEAGDGDLPGEEIGAENPEDDPEAGLNIGEEIGAENPEDDPEAGSEEAEPATPQPLNNLPVETPVPEVTAAPEVTEEPTAEPSPEVTAEPKLTVSACEAADPAALITQEIIYNGTKKASEYARAAKDLITMPVGGEYTKKPMGVLTFRGDAFRQNAASGTVQGASALTQAWKVDAGFVKGSGQNYYGISWTGQPAIVLWSKEVREKSELYDSKKEKVGLKEVIVAGLDGRIYFLDLTDGTATRNSIKLGYPMKGTPSVHPGGAPYFSVGQYARKMASGTGKIGLRQYNLYLGKEMSLIDGLDGKTRRAFNSVGSFETSALIDRTSDTLITAGTNGLLYVINMGSTFDYKMGTYTQSPAQVLLKTKAKGESDADTAVEASVAMYDRYVFYADMGGVLRCVDTNSMKTQWAVQLADAVESTPALDLIGNTALDLYTATTLTAKKTGNAEVCCYNALSGELKWTSAFGVKKDTKNKTVSGFRASPVVGQKNLGSLVYYTVNNLSEEEQSKLKVGESNGAIVAMYKTNGQVAWSRGLNGTCYSSPVAVYDESGNGWIIQCSGDGKILLMEGQTGRILSELQVEGAIEASPAVYKDMMVVGTTQKGSNYIYGIRIE